MTGLALLIGLGMVMLGAWRLRPSSQAPATTASGWLHALTDDVSLMWPWVAMAPICWAGSLYLIQHRPMVDPMDPSIQVAMLLGAVPLVGGLASVGLALLRASRVAERVSVELEHRNAALVLAASSATAFGAAGGLTVRAFQAVVGF